MEQFLVKVDGSGRILLPAKVRKQLNLSKDTQLIARLEKQKLVLNTRADALREVQEFFSKLRPAGVLPAISVSLKCWTSPLLAA